MKKLVFALGAVILLAGNVFAQKVPTLEIFYGAECPHCHEELEWLSELEKMYPDLRVEKYEVWHNAENKALWNSKVVARGEKPRGVPTNIIGDEVVVGFTPAAIRDAMERQFGIPTQACEADKLDDASCTNSWEKYLKFPWPAMSLVLGLIDGFNPCAMWSLFILLGFLLSLESRRKRFLIGGVFIGMSGVVYFAALLTYLLGFSQISVFVAGNVMQWIFRAVGALAVGTGLSVLWSVRKAKIECTVRDAKSRANFSKRLQEILERKNLWLVLLGVTGLALSVNAVELLCSFAIPTTFTASLISANLGWWEQISALLIYDFAYMLDDILVFFVAMWTLSLKIFSQKLVQVSHLAGGLLLLLLGAFLIWNPALVSQILG